MTMTNQVYTGFQFPSNIPFQIQIVQVTDLYPHWHSATQILFVLNGELEAEVDGEVSLLSDGDLLLVNRYCIHEIRGAQRCMVLCMELDLHKFDLPKGSADQLWFSCDSSRDPVPGRYDNLRTLISLIAERNATQDDTALYDNKSFAYSLLKELIQNFQVPVPSPEQHRERYLNRMEPVARYVEEHYRENLSLESLAAQVHMSPPYLSSLFTRWLGTTFSNYYNCVRLCHAVDDLLSTEDSINTVALNNGYANAQAFVRAFKARYRCLPSAYRQARDPDGERRRAGSAAPASGFKLSMLHRGQSGQDAAGPEAAVQADWEQITGVFGNQFRKIIGVGSAKELLYQPIQEQLRAAQEAIGFEYVKFHGLLSDQMMVVSRDTNDELVFDFKQIDMVFDFLFSLGLKPFIQLSFMPVELAQDKDKMIMYRRFNTSQPASLDDWRRLVRELLLHLFARYGRGRIEALPVLVWHNADTSKDMFAMQDDEMFYRLYLETFRTIRDLDPTIQIGSPALTFMSEQSIRWAQRFFLWLQEQGVQPDFLCAQYYSDEYAPGPIKIDLHSARPDNIIGTPAANPFEVHAGIPLSADPDNLRRRRGIMDDFFRKLGLSHLPLYITEWNLTTSHHNLINDTQFMGCYLVKNMAEHMDGVAGVGYWPVSDFIEEQPLPDATFHGGLGLMTSNGIRKPQFNAMLALCQMAPQVLARGEGYLVTRGKSILTILTYNYEHFSRLYAANKTYNTTAVERYTPFQRQQRRQFRFRVSGLSGKRVRESVEFINNRDHGSAFDFWVKMGAPPVGGTFHLDQYRLKLLQASAEPFVHTVQLDVTGDSLEYRAVLEPLEFRVTLVMLHD